MQVVAPALGHRGQSALLIPRRGLPNALAAAGCAALGIGEVFLRTLIPARSGVAFELSLNDYATGPLGSLDPGDAFHHQLARTALAFLDNGRRLDQTAAALFTHPNTVRYRLGRLRQITSTSLADGDGPLAALHWWWALTAWLESAESSTGR